jgi:23S rRNA (pseudouridine1915-N3)-methyltransferase
MKNPMFSFVIRRIGHPTESWQKEAIHSFVERLGPFARIEVQDLPEGHGNASKPDPEKTLFTEAKTLLRGLKDTDMVIALDQTGKNLDSETLAKKIQMLTEQGQRLFFVIGGSWGLHASVRSRAQCLLSLGAQTMPHNLALIVLLEQLYRTATITAGKTYHK